MREKCLGKIVSIAGCPACHNRLLSAITGGYRPMLVKTSRLYSVFSAGASAAAAAGAASVSLGASLD